MREEVLRSIGDQVNSNSIILYMKGSPAAPECGFSARTVRCLIDCGHPFAYINILIEIPLISKLINLDLKGNIIKLR